MVAGLSLRHAAPLRAWGADTECRLKGSALRHSVEMLALDTLVLHSWYGHRCVDTCSFLIIINIININLTVSILSVLEFVQECALEFVLEFVASAQSRCCM